MWSGTSPSFIIIVGMLFQKAHHCRDVTQDISNMVSEEKQEVSIGGNRKSKAVVSRYLCSKRRKVSVNNDMAINSSDVNGTDPDADIDAISDDIDIVPRDRYRDVLLPIL